MAKQVSVVYLVKDPPLDRLAAQVEFMRAVADEFVFVVDSRTSLDDVKVIESWPGTIIQWIEWCDDFAWARNQGLQLVSNPWTLHLDPDELPTVAMMQHIVDVTQQDTNPGVMGYIYWTPNWWGGKKGEEMPYHWHVRLWRTGHGWFYRKVHELVAIDGQEESMTRDRVLFKAPKSAYLIHSKEWDKAVSDQDYYEQLGERSL